MNGTTLERPDVAAYLDAVRARLDDLPAEERDDLVADVEASLLESGEPPALSPEEFAAELREAAGLAPESAGVAESSSLDSLRSWLSSDRAAAWWSTARELAPIWWLVRAYVVVVLLALATGQGWPVGSGTSGNPISFETSILALLAAGAISIWLGLRGRRGPQSYRRLGVAANVALSLALLPVAVHSFDQLSFRSDAEPIILPPAAPGFANDGVPVQNIYPYSRDGELLYDVFLYDEHGLPLEVLGAPDPARRVLTGSDGTPHLNSYPIRYYEPGTETVARPGLTPSVILPGKIVTPELPVK